ncbi:MAG: hypothetical protein KDB63_22855, partial [Nocardioidaceae bacterium]|nr:hypothetical protein [Nocardioidaceae bacterium]
MSIKNRAYIAGAFEHPTRHAPDKSLVQLHAECAIGALADAGLSKNDIDAFYYAGDASGISAMSLVDYLNLKVRHVDGTETGGTSYLLHVSHAAQAIAAGKCNAALITLAGRPRSEGHSGAAPRATEAQVPESQWESPFSATTVNLYALCAQRHMYEFGTTPEQLAWVKVAASHHAQHNPNAMLKNVVTVEEVLASPMQFDPLTRYQCCPPTCGAAAAIVCSDAFARKHGISNPVFIAAQALTTDTPGSFDEKSMMKLVGYDMSKTAAQKVYEQSGMGPENIDVVELHDCFSANELLTYEALGLCP